MWALFNRRKIAYLDVLADTDFGQTKSYSDVVDHCCWLVDMSLLWCIRGSLSVVDAGGAGSARRHGGWFFDVLEVGGDSSGGSVIKFWEEPPWKGAARRVLYVFQICTKHMNKIAGRLRDRVPIWLWSFQQQVGWGTRLAGACLSNGKTSNHSFVNFPTCFYSPFLPNNRHYHHACFTSQYISTRLFQTVNIIVVVYSCIVKEKTEQICSSTRMCCAISVSLLQIASLNNSDKFSFNNKS